MFKNFIFFIFSFNVFFICLAENNRNGDLDIALNLQNTFAKVADKALPSVVIVKTAKKIKQYYYIPQDPQNAPFNSRFFRRQGKILEQESNPIPSGQASGFIFNENGFILTNYHVVRDQSNFKIVLHDGKEYDAKIVGIDDETDLAVLKIDSGKKLPYLKFADSDKVKVGHFTIAVGAPFGLEHTVTTGIVSFKGRSSGMNLFQNYIQTDAAINPGNSGGPLLNLHGEVIGVSDFILTPPGSQGNIGLGFAISSKIAEKTAQQLMTKGKAEKPWLGIGMSELTPDLKSTMKTKGGVIVSALYRNGPADQAGIKWRDIIVKIAEVEVSRPDDVQQTIINLIPGDMVDLEIIRDGRSKLLKVNIGSKPADLHLDLQDHWKSQ